METQKLVIALSASILISGCSSGVLVDREEAYRGPVGVAVLPTAGTNQSFAGHGQDLGQQIQFLIQSNLETSGLFAHVEKLPAANAANEADVIIAPVLLELLWQGPSHRQGNIRLRITATRKYDRKIILDQTYKGSCSACQAPRGAPPVAGPMEEPLRKLTKDLARKVD